RGEDELQVGEGHDEVDRAVDLAAEIGVEPDAQDQHPQDRAADAADELAAIAEGALHLAQPQPVKSSQLDHQRRTPFHRLSPAHLGCSPPRRPNARVRSRTPAPRSRSSRPVSDRKTVSRLGTSILSAVIRVPNSARSAATNVSSLTRVSSPPFCPLSRSAK